MGDNQKGMFILRHKAEHKLYPFQSFQSRKLIMSAEQFDIGFYLPFHASCGTVSLS